ncbi:MAG: tetratricopeptide repeat protein [Verrucomicrobiota bacterium]
MQQSTAQPKQSGSFPPAGWKRDWLPALGLVAITILAYSPVWHAGFIWDDDIHVTANRLLWEADGLRKIWFSSEAPQYYPLVFTSLRLDYALWGANPAGYHWVNLLLHAASSLLTWRVLRRLGTPGAWLAAAVFAVHPVNVETVAWISQRKNALCMVFYLLSLLLYLRSDDPSAEAASSRTTHPASRLPYWLSVVAFILALLSKTAVAPMPLVLLGLAWWRRGRVTTADLWRAAPFFGTALLLGIVTVWFEHLRVIPVDAARADSFWCRLAGAGWAVWFYLYKAALPLSLITVYPRWQINPSNPLSYLPGALLLAAFFFLWRFRRSWGRPCLFCLFYYVAMLLPVLGFANIGFMIYSRVADHWQYFAIIGPIALAAGWFSSSFKDGIGLRLKVPAAAALVLILSGLTWRQSLRYEDEEAQWAPTLAQNPAAWIAHHQLGSLLQARGRNEEALAHYVAALKLHPDFARAHNNLGLILGQQGRPAEAGEHFLAALRINPSLPVTHYLLGGLLDRQGRADEAGVHYQAALDLQPDFPEACNDLGGILAAQNRWRDAADLFLRAVRLKPDYAEAHNNLGTAYMAFGRLDEAATEFGAALRINPDYADARGNLGKALYYQRRGPEAAAHFAAVLQSNPDSLEAMDLLARIRATSTDAPSRNGPEAVQLAVRAADLSGHTNGLVLDTLAAAYAEAGRFADAVRTAEDAVRQARAAGQTNLAVQLAERVKLYQSQKPFHE